MRCSQEISSAVAWAWNTQADAGASEQLEDYDLLARSEQSYWARVLLGCSVFDCTWLREHHSWRRDEIKSDGAKRNSKTSRHPDYTWACRGLLAYKSFKCKYSASSQFSNLICSVPGRQEAEIVQRRSLTKRYKEEAEIRSQLLNGQQSRPRIKAGAKANRFQDWHQSFHRVETKVNSISGA